MVSKTQTIGYLPDERPPNLEAVPLRASAGRRDVPGDDRLALLTGFHVSTTIFASGLATICFILITGRQLPLYYGSSFSYLAAITTLMATDALSGYSLNEKIAVAQFGIVMSGFVPIAAGFLVRACGKESIDKILPATVTGPHRDDHRPDAGRERAGRRRQFWCQRDSRRDGVGSRQPDLDGFAGYAAGDDPVLSAI
jgi:uracil permease